MAYTHSGHPGRILVNPDRLRDLAAKLRGVAGDLHPVAGWLDRVPREIEMELQACFVVENDMARAANLARTLAQRADELARYLVGKAQGFEEADSTGVKLVDGLHVQFVAMEKQQTSAMKNWLETQIVEDRDNTKGRDDDQCVSWARQRRASLGGGTIPAIGQYSFPGDPNPLGAKHLADIYHDKGSTGVQLQHLMEHSGQSLDQLVKPGSLIVWGATTGNPDGHVAVVEYVTSSGIWISESNNPWGSSPHIRPALIPVDALTDDVFIIPPGS